MSDPKLPPEVTTRAAANARAAAAGMRDADRNLADRMQQVGARASRPEDAATRSTALPRLPLPQPVSPQEHLARVAARAAATPEKG